MSLQLGDLGPLFLVLILQPPHFQLFENLMMCLVDKQFAADADMKQAVTSWVYRHFTPISSTPKHKPWCHGRKNA
jgi:hypothetical protein